MACIGLKETSAHNHLSHVSSLMISIHAQIYIFTIYDRTHTRLNLYNIYINNLEINEFQGMAAHLWTPPHVDPRLQIDMQWLIMCTSLITCEHEMVARAEDTFFRDVALLLKLPVKLRISRLTGVFKQLIRHL